MRKYCVHLPGSGLDLWCKPTPDASRSSIKMFLRLLANDTIGALERKTFGRAAIEFAAEAADGVELGRIGSTVGAEDGFVHVREQDAAKNHIGRERAFADVDDGMQAA